MTRKRTNSCPNSTTDFRDKQYDSGSGGDVDVGHTGLCGDLGSDSSETTSEALQNLGYDNGGISSIGTARMDHDSNTQETNGESKDEDGLKDVSVNRSPVLSNSWCIYLVTVGHPEESTAQDSKDGKGD